MVTSSPAVEPVPCVQTDAREATQPRVWPVLDYLGISLLIMLPLWRPGFILTMDAVFVPHERFVAAPQLSMQPIVTAIAVLNLVVPADIVEKLLFTTIFLLAGLGMHRLVEARRDAARYLAGLLAVFNPFVYDRLMYGQWTILLGYALLPWLFACLRSAVAKREESPAGPALRVAAWWTAITIASIPMGLIAGTAIVILIGSFLVLTPGRGRRAILFLASITALWFAVLNAYWIIPQVIAPSADAIRALHFGTIELTAFATQADGTWGSVLTVLGGYGFWAEGSVRFTDLRSAIPYWPVEAVGLVALATIAVGHTIRGRRQTRHSKPGDESQQLAADSAWLTIGLSLCLVIATVLAIGVASAPTAALTRFLFTHVTLYHGLRDTEKWVALILVAEIALAALGLDLALTRLEQTRQRTTRALAAGCLLLPILFAPTLFWGCAGQLQPAAYPLSWFSANDRLRADHRPGMTLFLPWHEYLQFPFVGRVIANPAQSFFDVPIIQGDNMEMRLIRTDSANPTSAAISRIISSGRAQGLHLAPALANLHIKYILLAKTADWRASRSLLSAPGLRVIGQWADLLLYRNAAWHG